MKRTLEELFAIFDEMRRNLPAYNLGSYTSKLMPAYMPDKAWYQNVRTSIPRKEWNEIRKAVFRAAGNVCEVCGGTYGLEKPWPLECHEVWTYVPVLHIQRLQRLIALCPLCHATQHLGLAYHMGNYDEVFAHLMKVNDMDALQTGKLVEHAQRMYRLRNLVEWKLDISNLQRLIPTEDVPHGTYKDHGEEEEKS